MQLKTNPRLLCIVLSVCVLVVTIFIFSNSFADTETSHEISGKFIDIFFLRQLLDNENVQLIVRKMAHMAESFVLGGLVFELAYKLRDGYRKSLFGFSFFYVLGVAVTDEYIQTFSLGRTGCVADVLLDFIGAMIGFCFVFLINLIFFKSKKRAN